MIAVDLTTYAAELTSKKANKKEEKCAWARDKKVKSLPPKMEWKSSITALLLLTFEIKLYII